MTRRPSFSGMSPALPFVALGFLVLSCGVLAGCSRSSSGTGPGARVYVNLDRLVQLRPGWQGVRQIDAQLAALRGAHAAAPLRARMTAAAQISLPSISPAVTAAMVQPTPAALPGTGPSSVAADAATTRAELERDARGEEALFERSAPGIYLAEFDAEQRAVQDRFASTDRSIRQKYEFEIINLRIQRDVLQKLGAQLKPSSPAVPGLQAAATSPQLYGRVLNQLDGVLAKLAALGQQERSELRANDRQLADALAGIAARFRAAVEAVIRRHQNEAEARISQRVQEELLDLEEEARQRIALYQNRSFRSPLAEPLSAAAPAPPPGPPMPAPGVSTSASTANQPSEAAAVQGQESALEQQRTVLARLLTTDTQRWVEAAASRERWTVTYQPAPGVEDATPQVAVWIQEDTIPAMRIK